MPIKETLTASPAAFADVLTNGKRYLVPHFQRDYAWGETEWSELWTDIVDLGTPAGDQSNHYLGALVLQPTGERGEMNIIDGQQRLVTLSLLSLAVIVRIEHLADSGQDEADNRERARLLRERFVSTKDSASLQHRSRLRLNATDDGFYQTYLVQGRTPPRPNALQGSEARLYSAFSFFANAIENRLGRAATGTDLARFLEDVIATRLRFIEIIVEDDETAFTVFETLNARGVALGTADLLKNYLFAIASRGGASDLEQARLWWTQILRLVPMEQVASLLFHKLAGRIPDLREKRVFTEVKRLVPEKESVFDFLNELKDAADIYAGLDDANSDFWSELADARKSVRVLRILRAEQCRPVILAAFAKLSDRPDRLARLLKNLMVISVRASTVRVNTGDLQRAYQSVAIQIGKGELKSPAAIARALSGIIPSDDEFRSAFAVLEIDPKGSRKRWLRYLLGELEAASEGGHVIDFDAADATIEHILPENPGAGWDAFTAEDRRRDLTRLGNLTPLERSLNRAIGSETFEDKLPIYHKSSYRLTRDISATEWTPSTVRARQAKLADIAINVWRIETDD